MMRTPILRIAVLLTLVGGAVITTSAVLLHRSVEQIRRDHALVEQRETLAGGFERLLKDLQETEADRAALARLRPNAQELVKFVEGLEAVAARAFIEQAISAVPPEADLDTQPYNLPVVRYRITLRGNAEKVEAYLRELQRLPELIRLERMELRALQGGSMSTDTAADLLLAVTVQNGT